MQEITVGKAVFQIVVGDITKQDTEAVVNAANAQLAPGGGVAGAIHRAAGPKLWEECATLGGCATGEAKLSKGYNLPNAYVIHTVGPVYGGREQDPEFLRSCYLKSLELADKHGITSVAFPALGMGIFGYPVKDAAQVSIDAILGYLKGSTAITLVRMVLYDQAAYQIHGDYLNTVRV